MSEWFDTLFCNLVLLVFVGAPIAFITWLVWP